VITKAYAIKALLAAVPLALGVTIVSAEQKITVPSLSSTQTHKTTPAPSSVTPSPAETPHVTVNGRTIPTDANGNMDLSIPEVGAHVKISNGHTSVTSNSNNANSFTSVKGSNIDINVHSDALNGIGRSTTHIESSATNRNGTSSSSTITNVFSTGSANVSNQP
jgi:hypothetical protein